MSWCHGIVSQHGLSFHCLLRVIFIDLIDMWKLVVPLHLALLFSSGVVPLYHVEAGFGGEQTVEKSTVLFTYLLSPDFALGSRGLQQQLFGAFASSAWRQARFASGKSTAIKIAPSVVDFLYFLQQHSILLFNLSAIV